MSTTTCLPLHPEWNTVDDATDYSRPAVVVGFGLEPDLADLWIVIRLYAAAQSVGKQSLGKGFYKQVLLAEQYLAQSGRAVKPSTVGQHARGINGIRY